jgi:hypothetical protein
LIGKIEVVYQKRIEVVYLWRVGVKSEGEMIWAQD